jgi:hypothetical protein
LHSYALATLAYLLRKEIILHIRENNLSNFMQNLTIEFQRSYRKAGKTPGAPSRLIFVYRVTGTALQLTQFRDIQSANLREDDKGNPIFFTSRYAGETAMLTLNHTGDDYYVDNTAMDKQASLVAQYGGNLGQAIAMQIASQATGIVQQPLPAASNVDKTQGLGIV